MCGADVMERLGMTVHGVREGVGCLYKRQAVGQPV